MSNTPVPPRDAAHPFHGLNRLFDALGRGVPPHSCDVVVLDGALDVDRLRSALTRAVARHPVLSSQRVGSGAGAAWRLPSTPLPIDLRLAHHDTHDPDAVDRALVANIWDEPLADSALPVRFHLIRAGARSYLQTIHTHVYADATSCYRLTRDVADAYDGADAHAASRDCGPRELDSLFFGAPTRPAAPSDEAQRAWAEDRRRAPGGLALPDGPPGTRRMTRAVYSVAETRRLRHAARARGCSIHAFFKLAFVRTAAAFNRARGGPTEQLRAWDFFSLRSLAPQTSEVYDCFALIYPDDFDAREDDDAILAQCTRNIRVMRRGALETHARRLDLLVDATDGGDGERSFGRVWPQLFKSNVFLTNPGVVPTPLECVGGVRVLDYVTFPQLFHPARLMFVFSTFRDRLRVLTLHDESAFDGCFEGDFFDPFLHELCRLSDARATREAGDFIARWNDPAGGSA